MGLLQILPAEITVSLSVAQYTQDSEVPPFSLSQEVLAQRSTCNVVWEWGHYSKQTQHFHVFKFPSPGSGYFSSPNCLAIRSVIRVFRHYCSKHGLLSRVLIYPWVRKRISTRWNIKDRRDPWGQLHILCELGCFLTLPLWGNVHFNTISSCDANMQSLYCTK